MSFLPNDLVDIINHSHNLAPDRRLEIFERLAEKVSLIPVRGGFPNTGEDPKLFKAPIEKDWPRWGKTRRNFLNTDFSSDRAGIACGPASGILVLDIDNLEKFTAWLSSKKIHFDFNTFTVSSSGNSRGHLYYTYPSDGIEYKSRSNTNGGFDVRGIGGQVICPGSFHPVAKTVYTIVKNCDLETPPQWLLDFILEEKTTHKQKIELDQFIDSLPIPDQQKQNIVAHIPEGKRSEISIGVMESLLRHGIDEDTIKHIYEQYPIGAKAGEKEDNWYEKEMEQAKKFIQDKQAPRISPASNQDIIIYSALDIVKADVKFEFMIDRVWAKGESLLLTGIGGVGKSLMTLQLVMDLVNPPAKGFLDTFAIPVNCNHKILFVQSENTLVGIQKRLSAIRNPHSGYIIDDQILKNSIFFAGTGNNITTRGDIEDKSFRHKVSLHIEKTNADIIVVDPLISFHNRDENSNDKMRKVLDTLINFCNDMNVSPLVVHHEGKADIETGQGGGRGASAIGDWSPNTWKLSRNNKTKEFTFSAKKSRNSELPDEMKLELHHLRFRPLMNSINNDKISLVIQALKENNGEIQQQNKLIEAMGNILKAEGKDTPSGNTLRTCITKAVESGFIQQTGSGQNLVYKVK